MRLNLLTTGIILLLCQHFTHAQLAKSQTGILFYQLNTSHGLTDNYVNDMCTDQGGNLWVATGEGLNMFNGKTVVKFFSQEYPQLENDDIRQIICDSKNRIWVRNSSGHVTVIDELRRFHRAGIYNEGRWLPIRRIIDTESKGVILFSPGYQLTFNPANDLLKIDSIGISNFTPLTIEGSDSLFSKNFREIERMDDDQYVFTSGDEIFRVNYRSGKIENRLTIPAITLLGRWDAFRVICYDERKLAPVLINLITGEFQFPFNDLTDQNGRKITARITNASMIRPGQFLLTSRKHGVYLFDTTARQLVNHVHNASDPSTIINNSPTVIATDSSGWVFIGATPNGISYYKNNAVIGQQSVFLDKQGNSYDGYINAMVSRDNDNYYIGVSDELLLWKRSTNTTRFISRERSDLPMIRENDVNYLAFDDRGRLWVSLVSKGIYILDEQHRVVRFLNHDSTRILDNMPSNYIRHMTLEQDHFMWISTRLGIVRVNTETFGVDRLESTPLSELNKTSCARTWFENEHTVWVATENKGAWRYDLLTNKLTKFDKTSGIISNNIICFNKDRNGNIYVGTGEGLSILLADNRIRNIAVADGLMNRRIEALLLDKNNRMWIGNDVGLACYSIRDSSLKVFDERYGLSVQGFRVNSYLQNSDDELIWGTERGLQYFYPDELLQQKVSLSTTVNRVETRDLQANLTKDGVFQLNKGDNYVTFYFTSIDYSKHLRTFYQYKLEGVDEDWVKVVDQNFVRYSSLSPGTYRFKVRSSNDNVTWEEAENTVTITVPKQLWEMLWFKIVAVLAVCLLVWYAIRLYRRRQLKQREVLETEVVINYFASRINRHQRTEDILWDVAENCISKLHFEDCVIYLLDTDRHVLVQKAAFGPKVSREYTIHEPIEIPVGKGIVGNVAKTGKAELISNTDTDDRYIADDVKRQSEVAVPLLIDDKVIGVIDSEHSRRNFFTQQHVNILTTIAVLCSNQIQRAKAEEEKQHAKIESLENKQKVTESRLQSLRLQMNPHFLFNALNSIQQMILANEELVATKYLSRFSRLLRTILIHSDKETISLKEELDILGLYVELESVRFKDSFSYSIECEEHIDKEELKVPALLVQPFVENAIWHGLMHKEGRRELKIRFMEKEDYLQCIIEDNGIGRLRSQQSKPKNGKSHESKGIGVSLERLQTLRNASGNTGSLAIIDLVDDNGEALGTRVEINFPIQN